VEQRQGWLAHLVINPGFWQGRRVFLTGHTGFKGSWLALMLQELGAQVHGFALPPQTTPSLFDDADISSGMHSPFGDIRDMHALQTAMHEARPSIVLHLAAQAIVSTSFEQPLDTLQTNIIGTANLLQAVRETDAVQAVVVVTSDKCYENHESGQAYREDEALGGKDPYSASKACTEIVTASWRHAFFSDAGQPVLATARAGNVIGGGDWSRDRLLPDMVRALMRGESVQIRNPDAVRPWQHVLEPLVGYLTLAESCVMDASFGQAWNFGPDEQDARSVRELMDDLVRRWGDNAAWQQTGSNPVKESHLLRLDSSKARTDLGWQPRTDIGAGLQLTVDWYKQYAGGADAATLTRQQIRQYLARD
jgi:CDP-glucose 4,6-dehydratase